jgi:hypothetical protein
VPKYLVDYTIVKRGSYSIEAESEEAVRKEFTERELDVLDDRITEEDMKITSIVEE